MANGFRLVLDSKVASIGAIDGDRRVVFGLIADAQPLSGSEVLIVDSRLNGMRIFRDDGRFVAEFGRAGSGPGEFLIPGKVAIDQTGRIHAFDAALQRISVFHRVGTTVVLDTVLTVPGETASMCMIGNKYYLLGLQDAHLIREVSSDGLLLRRFGSPFGGPGPMLQASLSRGLIACFPSLRLVVVVAKNLPEMRAYSVDDGSLKWLTPIRGYTKISVTQPTRRTVRYAFPPQGGHDYALSLTPMSDTLTVFQFGYLTTASDGPRDVKRITSCLVRVADGVEVGRQSNMPWLLGLGDGVAFAVRDDPFPHLDVLPYSVSRGL